MVTIKRIMDANLNRSREGLRVLEDLTRFVQNDSKSTAKIKKLRHKISQIALHKSIRSLQLLETRDSRRDVGKKSLIQDSKKIHCSDLAAANLKRVEESLRVLEECSKMIAPAAVSKFQALRFETYELEKEIIKKLFAVRHH